MDAPEDEGAAHEVVMEGEPPDVCPPLETEDTGDVMDRPLGDGGARECIDIKKELCKKTKEPNAAQATKGAVGSTERHNDTGPA